jgi:predicted aminopeptidase
MPKDAVVRGGRISIREGWLVVREVFRGGSRAGRLARRVMVGLVLVLVVVAVSGCQTFSFYRQAIKGQYQIIADQQKIEKLVADPKTPARLKEKLQLVQDMRAFARRDLKLPVDGHYEKYADVHRPFVVWNVEAAPEFSLKAKSWWYPFVGRLDYRGYFSEGGARDYGGVLEGKGYDIYVGGVAAYSTLGWFKDPVLNTFIYNPEPDLAETIFHELGHQRVFAHGDTDFNEAFATIVGQEGARRWLRAKGDTNVYARYEAELRRTDQFVHLVANARNELKAIYRNERKGGASSKASGTGPTLPPEELRQQKQQVFAGLQRSYAELKASHWLGDTQYDGWFAHGLNNAKLNSVAQYYDLLPAFKRLLELNGGNLEMFYAAAEELAHKPKKERTDRLIALAEEQGWAEGRIVFERKQQAPSVKHQTPEKLQTSNFNEASSTKQQSLIGSD